MRIKQIIEPKGKKDTFILIFQDESLYEISKEVYFKRDFKIGEDVEIKDLDYLISEDYKVKARELALSSLDRGLKTEKEVEDKLLENNIPKNIIDETITKIKDYGYIDDDHLTRVYIEDKLFNKGKLKIKNELIKKGIDKETFEEVYSIEHREKEKEVILDLAKKKYTSLIKREDDKRKLRDKLTRFLISKGYEYDLIKYAISRVIKTNTDIDYYE